MKTQATYFNHNNTSIKVTLDMYKGKWEMTWVPATLPRCENCACDNWQYQSDTSLDGVGLKCPRCGNFVRLQDTPH